MHYQDHWKYGTLIEKGERDCESRYQEIRKVALRYKRAFTVLDIGANAGYFTIRLAEEFPNCVVIAVEPEGDLASHVTHLNNVVLLKKKLSQADLSMLARCEYFDIVLCLSVLHYLDEDKPYKEALDKVTQLGTNIFLELPVEKKTLAHRYDEMHQLIKLCGNPIAMISSHVDASLARPMFLLKGSLVKDRLSRWGEEYQTDAQLDIDDNKLTVTFSHKGEKRDWYHGINLWTYIQADGVYPAPIDICSVLVDCTRWEKHRDVCPWNVIVSGRVAHIIDRDDPGHSIIPTDEQVAIQVDKLMLFILNKEKTFKRE